jgi:hypothetical protein
MMIEVIPTCPAATASDTASVVLPVPPFWAIRATVYMADFLLCEVETLRLG